MSIGTKLKNLRIQNKLSQKELSKLTNISEISIRKYEKNERNPKIETLKKIAIALNVPLTDLMNDSLHHFAIASAYEQTNRAMSNINDSLTDSFNYPKDLTHITVTLEKENIKYIEKLSKFYEMLEQLKQTDKDIETIEGKITKFGLENFKDILEEFNLDIILESLYLRDSINDFLEDPKDINTQRILNSLNLNIPQGKKLKLTLIDSE